VKLLLSMLIKKLDHPWWSLRSSEGDPPEEREGHYIFSALRMVIRSKLQRVEKEERENEVDS
jgi:hypothetical protein